jgi:aldose sugar dehydrogenase
MATTSAVGPVAARAAGTLELVTITKGLDHPWGIAFLSDGSARVTERLSRLRRIVLSDKRLLDPIIGTPAVADTGEGALLGIAIDPDFKTNRVVLVPLTENKQNGGRWGRRVV